MTNIAFEQDGFYVAHLKGGESKVEATQEMVEWVGQNADAQDLTLKFEYRFDLSMSEAENLLDQIEAMLEHSSC